MDVTPSSSHTSSHHSSPHRTRSGPGFGPRPEAKALKWDELLPNTQRAMEELINWLDSARAKSQGDGRDADNGDGAPSREEGSEEQLATSVLVSGDRGYGKTTLLLTTSYALRKPEEFLGLDPHWRGDGSGAASEEEELEAAVDPDGPRPRKRQALGEKLRRLGSHLVWLDPLDMEPLPTQANLLATLLVRVRNALDSDHHRQGRWAPPSLLEEGLDDPYGRIDQLVRNATFMWEDIAALGQDPRQRADQQIKAAEIYATFRRDFFSAMERVSGLLAERRFGHDSREKTLLVLPIDNVDRSIQHLHLILKLTRMVASRRLWFVLASGRSEFQLFLERTFQTELSSGGQAPLGAKGREETFSIARRQAAAAMRRVLPHVHRIKIEHVSPGETWNFQAAPSLMGGAREPFKLYTFLSRLPLACKGRDSHGLESFADLLDISRRLRCPLYQAREGGEAAHDQGELLEECRELQRAEGNSEEEASSAATPPDRAPLPQRLAAADRHRLQQLLAEGKTEELRAYLRGKSLLDGYTLTEKEVRQGAIELLTKGLLFEKRPAPVFTYPARLALALSARTALDFWQAAESKYQEWRRHQDEKPGHRDEDCGDCQELAIGIADTMLRTSIDESDLPGWASEQLHNRIMRTNARGVIVLDLTGKPVRRLKVTSLSDVLEWNPEEHGTVPHLGEVGELGEGSSLVRTELHLRHFQDDILELHDTERPGRRVPLPPNVAGWFMVLHDLLVFTKEQRVLNISVTPYDTTPAMAVTLHTVQLEPLELTRLGFWWLPPNWDTFIDFAIFTTQWKAFIHRVQNLFEPRRARDSGQDEAVDEAFAAHRFVFLVAAWVDNVCSVANSNRGGWCWKELGEVVRARDEPEPACPFAVDKLQAYVRAVLGRVDTLYRRTRHASTYGRGRMAQVWLDESLPLLLHPEFIPARCLDVMGLRDLWNSELGKSRWRQNQAYLAVMRRELVRNALRSSELYQQLWQLYSGGTGSSLQLRDWLLKATGDWLKLTKPQAQDVIPLGPPQGAPGP